jgi:hypothetical protein
MADANVRRSPDESDRQSDRCEQTRGEFARRKKGEANEPDQVDELN